MDEPALTDAQWAKMASHCLNKTSNPRLFMEGVLWLVRTGRPWTDLPPRFGKWNAAFKRFRTWVFSDAFHPMFEACSDDPDMRFAMVDGFIVLVPRPGEVASPGLPARPQAQTIKPKTHYMLGRVFHVSTRRTGG